VSLSAVSDKPNDELELVPGLFKLTDTGNAERFVARYRDDVRYVGSRKKWITWNGGEWEYDESGAIGRRVKATVRGIYLEANATNDPDVRKALKEWALKSEGAQKRAAIEQLSRVESGISIDIDELDRDPWLLNCANGTLDLQKIELHQARRSDLITKTTGVAYNYGATSALWTQVLHNMTGGDTELERYLQRVAGYALTGLSTERKFFFLHGPPGSGKSTFIVALLAALGTYGKATPFDTWIEHNNPGQNRDDLVSLQGVRLVTSGEVAPNKHWDTSLIKQITGGDRIVASAKYESQVSFQASCTIVLAANDSPKARDDDAGFWERMQRIPITYVVPESDRIKRLHERLREPENAQAILAWAVEGCREWERIGGIGTASAVTESTEAYQTENDWIGGFLESYELDDGALIPAPIFRGQYETYCKNEGQRPEATKTLAKRIEKRCPGVRYVMIRGARVWRGLMLKGDTGPQQVSLPRAPTEPPPAPREPEQRHLGFTTDPDDFDQEPPSGRFD
jgi:putative DNA primase/helicase